VTIYRWVLRFAPLLAEAVRSYPHAVGSRWQAANLRAVKAQLRQLLLTQIALDPAVSILDSFPMPVCRFCARRPLPAAGRAGRLRARRGRQADLLRPPGPSASVLARGDL
jgi:hypothetical protein